MHARKLLPLFAPPLGRQSVTCTYRCDDQCSRPPSNTSDNEYFPDVLASTVSRRGLLRAGAVLGVAGAVGAAATGTAPRALAASAPPPGLRFDSVKPNTEDAIVTPPGYTSDVLIRWGDPVLPNAPKFDFDKQTAAAQATQFGYNNDFCGLVPVGRDEWLMGSNHEYTTEPYMFRGYDAANPTREQVEIAWVAHAFSVVKVQRDREKGAMRAVVDRKYSRRITVHTPFEFTGPAAGSKFLRTKADPLGHNVLGTFGNCSGGVTPWGTILSGEENFHGYFAHAEAITDSEDAARAKRYGMGKGESERKWERFDDRFDLSANPNEGNRFGYVVEIDPHDRTSTPRKHTHLGRFKHEAATVRISRDGHVVVYCGDDEKFEYIYKFVSKGRYRRGDNARARKHNSDLLSDGTLYVARFTGDSPAAEIDGSGKLPSDGEFDGRGEWIPLASGNVSHVPGMSAEEVYVFTRQAADQVSATKMDRPEDIQPSPKTGRVYAALTNNTDRGKDGKEAATEPNPRVSNKHGHVLEWEEDGNDASARAFAWRLLLVCGDPNSPDTYFAGFDKSQVSPISCPDNVAFDRHGNLWIATDGSPFGNDALHALPLQGKERGHVKTFLTTPLGAETCGPVVERDFVLVSVQHPGEADNADADNPVSHWPDGGNSQPRPSVVYVRRTDNGVIGA